MPKPLRLGIAIEDTWAFFREIYADFEQHFQVSQFRRPQVNFPVFSGRLTQFSFERELARFLHENEVVFFEWTGELLAAASQLPKSCGIIARLHRFELYRYADRINWDVVDRLILVTEAKKQEFLAHYPFMAGRVVVIPEAVSLERFHPIEKPFMGDIGTLCTLIPRKRVYELILAYAEVVKRFPNTHLHIAGPEHDFYREYTRALKSLVERLKLEDRVTFYGRLEDPEVWYRKLDIFVSNSYSEGLQVALLEAMASGIISLSHFWEGAEEILPADHLFFTEAELVHRLGTCLEMPAEERARVQQNMIAKVAQHANIQETIARIRAEILAVAGQVPA
jgi:glycosyltransferase involved in cell wall biosynthesis